MALGRCAVAAYTTVATAHIAIVERAVAVHSATIAVHATAVAMNRCAGRAVARTAVCRAIAADVAAVMVEVTTVPAVQHAEVRAPCCRTEVVAASVVVAVSAYYVPGVSATIAGIEHGASEVEIVAVRIAGIDAEVPVAVAPVEWAVEVAGCAEGPPLPVEQDIAHVQIATLPVVAIDVVVARHTHQVVEIDFVGGLVLFVSQVQFIRHLIGQEQRLVACLFVAHCLTRCCYCQHCYQGHHHLLHSRKYFYLFDICYLFTLQN